MLIIAPKQRLNSSDLVLCNFFFFLYLGGSSSLHQGIIKGTRFESVEAIQRVRIEGNPRGMVPAVHSWMAEKDEKWIKFTLKGKSCRLLFGIEMNYLWHQSCYISNTPCIYRWRTFSKNNMNLRWNIKDRIFDASFWGKQAKQIFTTEMSSILTEPYISSLVPGWFELDDTRFNWWLSPAEK